MIYVIIGHRGTGKTSFLRRLKSYYESFSLPAAVFDLDHEVEERGGRSIHEIFAMGENEFRRIENEVFSQIVRENDSRTEPVYIAVGGGFAGQIPSHARIWWLRRDSDKSGRIFIDRPRLNSAVPPLDEFMDRYEEREKRFRLLYEKEITLSEGWDHANGFEATLLGLKPANLQVSITVLPHHVQSERRLECFLQDSLALGLRFIELRDDLLTINQIKSIAGRLPKDKVLISFRRERNSETKELEDFSHSFATDWPLELGPSPFSHNAIVSLHERRSDETVDDCAERLLQHKADHYKLSVPVHSFVELWSGHRFFSDAPTQRSFLPRSEDGRWHWYRLAQNKNMHINFARFGEGSATDQPLIFDFIRYPAEATSFAAVLGYPVNHSQTPAEHHEFFADCGQGVLAIPMFETECDALSMSVLERLGLRAAAVTSPLKNKVRELCAHVDKRGEELSAVNTLILTKSGWSGTNTDYLGLQAVFSSLDISNNVAVWGGGGTRLVLKSLLPQARFFSARRGEEIWVEKPSPVQPEVVIWALGRSRIKGTQPPPTQWRPEYVVDLNYTADSPGIEYALSTGAKYISGQAFFKNQAKAQRDFWSRAKDLC